VKTISSIKLPRVQLKAAFNVVHVVVHVGGNEEGVKQARNGEWYQRTLARSKISGIGRLLDWPRKNVKM
jgi:hypothetical protein